MADPTSPRCPATKILLCLSIGNTPECDNMSCIFQRQFLTGQFKVVLSHDPHELRKGHAWSPPELLPSEARIPPEVVHFSGTHVARVDDDVIMPVKLNV